MNGFAGPCSPTWHVAHSFVSALSCWRVHRGVAVAAVLCASLVGVSTLFTKQHYVLDVMAGIVLALIAYAVSCAAPTMHRSSTAASRPSSHSASWSSSPPASAPSWAAYRVRA